MHCPHCGGDNSTASAFCDACGAPLGQTCAACGHQNRPGSRFCARCSKPLALSAPPRLSSEQLLRSLSASGGERKRLTVLFADIRNSTGLIERIDPEQAMLRMKPVLEVMKNAVDRYDGVVNKVQGDGVMALFGAPRPREDHPVRACLAALAMQDAMVRIGDPDLKIRVGLHTGEVVVQAVESSLYQTYDAAGATVHLANRIEQMAEVGRILLTGETFAAAKQFVEAKSLGLQTIRGLSAPVEVFELLGVKHAPASELFRSRSRLSPLVGREQQFNALEAELANTTKGDARVVGVVGDAGIGKSRLCFEFAENCRRRGIRVYEARVLAHGRATPFQPVLELLRDYLGIKAAEPTEEARRRVVERLRNIPAGNETLPLVLDFLGLADAAYPTPNLDPVVRKTRLIDLVRNIARSGHGERATVVLIEDLHWIDTASAEFVEALADAVVDTKTMLLVNFRQEFAAPWMQRSHYRQISVARLDQTNADEFLRDLLGGDASLALVCRNIAERAQGNPFFIEELVHSLVERGDLEGERGAYRLTGGIDAIPLPATVEAVLAARIDRLEELAKQVLQSAAVIGREVPLAILERVTNLPSADIAEALWQLRRVELLHELPSHEQGHAFRHPLIQEVAYRSLLQERRRTLHGAVARAIEAQFKHRPEERSALLAYHLEQAGELLQAAQAHMRAAFWFGASDASQALRSWKKVRELLTGLPPSQLTDMLRMRACGQIMYFGWCEGISAEEAESYFEEAKRLALAAGNLRAHALILAGYGRILGARGSADEYVAKIREAEALAKGSNDASLQVTLKAILCHALRLAGWVSEALPVNIEAMSHAHEIGVLDRQLLGFDVELWLTVMRGQILIMLGRVEEARPYLDRLLSNVDHVDFTHHVASVAYVDLAWLEGDARLAEEHALRAFSIAIKSGSPYVRVHAQACRGLSHILAGRLDAAVEDLAEALSFARRRKTGLEIEARILADLANAYRLKRDFAAALHCATEAIDVAAARCARIPACLAHIVRADVLWATTGAIDRVDGDLREARDLIQKTGAIIYEPLLRDLETKLARHMRDPSGDPGARNATHARCG
jgi:class 3 adenylate cyclase/tetratricopeptide (TPR) repeat protein/nucleoside-triphosphatase THEP1